MSMSVAPGQCVKMLLRYAPKALLMGAVLMSLPVSAADTASSDAPASIVVAQHDEAADFTAIQPAVDAARPGDVIEVRAGRYEESVVFPRGGEPAKPITLRAAAGEIVLIAPSPPLAGKTEAEPEPEPVEGYPGLYRWRGAELPDDDPEKIGLWEASSHIRLVRVDSKSQAQRRLGSWHHDSETGDLYIRSTGLAPASELTYHFEHVDRPGIHVRDSHVVIEGLHIAFGAHGILLDRESSHVTVRGCRLFCNRSAGIHGTGTHHRLLENELFRNNQYGIQLRYGVHHTRVADNLAYYNGPSNAETTDTSVPADLGIYSRGSHVHFERNIVDGINQLAFRNKHAPGNTITARHNVVRGNVEWQSEFLEHNTLLTGSPGPRFGVFIDRVNPGPDHDASAADPDGRIARSNLVHPALHEAEPRFADPAHRDFRLQADSPYHGQGAHPEHARVIYVDPSAGSDENSGLTDAEPIRTLEHLTEVMHPGDTVYLMPGVYESPLAPLAGRDADEPTRIRAHRRSDAVILRGGVVLEEVSHVELDGLVVEGAPVRISESERIGLTQCVIADSPDSALVVEASVGVSFDRITFTGVERGIELRDAADVRVCHALFHDVQTPWAVDEPSLSDLYADHNHYAAFAATAGGDRIASLEDWQQRSATDRASAVGSVELGNRYRLPARSPLAHAGADFQQIGARAEAPEDRLEVTDLEVTGLSPNGASLLWTTPRGLTEAEIMLTDLASGDEHRITARSTFQIMGHVFDMTFRVADFFTVDHHAGLGALEPGREYEVRLTVRNIEGSAAHERTVRFETPTAAPASRTFYVGPEGDDEADGRSTSSAWASFDHAVRQVRPGDTVLVLPGAYPQSIVPRVSGTAERPIVFRSAEPREAVIDLREQLQVGVEIMNVDHVHIEGFSIRGGVFSGGHNFVIGNAEGVRVAGCRVELPAAASWDRLRLGHGGMVATHAPGLVVEDNVFACGYVGVGVAASDGARIAHNVIIGEGNYGVVMVPDDPDEQYHVTDNVFYRAIMGYKTGCQIWMMNVHAELTADRNLFFIPEDHNATIGTLPETERFETLAAWQEATGHDRSSRVDRPSFVDRDSGDFRLAPDSPGHDLGADDTPVGVRW